MLQRREFLKQTAVLAGVIGGGIPLPATGQATDPEVGIALVEADNPAAQTLEASGWRPTGVRPARRPARICPGR